MVWQSERVFGRTASRQRHQTSHAGAEETIGLSYVLELGCIGGSADIALRAQEALDAFMARWARME